MISLREGAHPANRGALRAQFLEFFFIGPRFRGMGGSDVMGTGRLGRAEIDTAAMQPAQRFQSLLNIHCRHVQWNPARAVNPNH